MRKYLLGLVAAALLACGDATAPSNALVVPNAVLVDPRSVEMGQNWLEGMWRDVQACSGLSGTIHFEDMTWFNVPAESFPYGTLPDTGTALGLFVGARRQIYVAHLTDWWRSVQVQRTTKHEILHALLYPISGHPPEWFVDGPCGDLTSDAIYHF